MVVQVFHITPFMEVELCCSQGDDSGDSFAEVGVCKESRDWGILRPIPVNHMTCKECGRRCCAEGVEKMTKASGKEVSV